MVPPDVCDAKQPVLRPSGGPEVDVTVAASPPRVVRFEHREILSGGRPSRPLVDQPAV
jgi:hypothetical protein